MVSLPREVLRDLPIPLGLQKDILNTNNVSYQSSSQTGSENQSGTYEGSFVFIPSLTFFLFVFLLVTSIPFFPLPEHFKEPLPTAKHV